MKASFSAKTSDTTGGKIADAIHQRASINAKSSPPEHQTSESHNVTSMGAPEGSFSSGSDDFAPQDDCSDEVRQFVNQKASGDSQ